MTPDLTLKTIMGFALSYAGILAIPGPNMLAIGGIAALRGRRAALPFCIGMAIGAGLLALVLHQTLSLSTPLRGVELPGRAAGALLLALMALQLLRQRAPVDEPGQAGQGRGEGPVLVAFGAGLCIAATNPLTGAFFLSQFLGMVAQLPGPAQVCVLLLVPLEALGIALLAASLLGSARARRTARAWHRPIRLLAAGALLALAARSLYSTVG
jgi:threonine/homoserine/homoserine lactone efflux protein